MRNARVLMLVRLALLSALAIALSLLEGIFTPLLPPGAKAGLSNTATMLAASVLGLPSALFITLIKAGFALLTRGALSFCLSLAGGVASALVLWLLFRYARRMGVLGISILGALTHTLTQLFVSSLLYGAAVFAYAPLLILLTLPAGGITAALLRGTETVFRKISRINKKGNQS